ncbi:MAG: ATP-grasp domain-containing protein [Oscillospiraceae bacterium]|nr:ATP-grasp domain-containing protein [Oscillospiraceae bacterium]
MNILFCSVGRRAELLKNFRKSLSPGSKIIATDMSVYAPAIYMADTHYIVPAISDEKYLSTILDICKKEKINAITTLIDPEIEMLAKNRELFSSMGVEVLSPYYDTAILCFDKFKLYKHLKENGVNTPKTYGSYDEAVFDIEKQELSFPVFVKPRTGSGSVGAKRIDNILELKKACEEDASLIIQEYMDSIDMDADVYIDTITHNPVSIFTKRKIETKIGGASKTVSFKDDKLVEFLCDALKHFRFNGPIDVDLFYKEGKYYLSEINPRFGGAYLHAYGAGVDFVKLIENNVNGHINEAVFNQYDDNVAMMMYDSVVIQKIEL